MDPKQKTAEQLAQENEELKAKIVQLEAQKTQAPAGALDADTEKEVRARIAAGLTREQALEVVCSQQAWDKKLAEEAEKAKAKK